MASRHSNTVPNGWVADPDSVNWPDVYWPFEVMKPVGIKDTEPALQEGDYVIITGALIEDTGHLHFDDPPSADNLKNKCWHDHYRGHGGWLEIHPLDAIRRVKAPMIRKHPIVAQVCKSDHTPSIFDAYLTPVRF